MKDNCLLCYSRKISRLTQLGHMERQISFPQGGLLFSSNSSQRHPSWQPQQCLTKHLVTPWPRQADTRILSCLSQSRHVKDCLASSGTLCYRMLFGQTVQDMKENSLFFWIFPVWDLVRRSSCKCEPSPISIWVKLLCHMSSWSWGLQRGTATISLKDGKLNL